MGVQLLSRLGYLDTHLNADLADAVDVFCHQGVNRRHLARLGHRVWARSNLEAKLNLLRSSFLSSRSYGQWQRASKDTQLRELLVKRCFIQRQEAPVDEIFIALQAYIARYKLES